VTRLAFTVLLLLTATAAAAPIGDPNVLTTSARIVCVPGYASSVRNVSEATKRAVYTRDHMVKRPGRCCEIDHRISLQLGGSNAITNLFAQPYPEAYSKDSVENWLHREVCAGRLPLTTAQREIARDWRVPYRRMRLQQARAS
jgi:hypothetical protein